MPGVGVKYIIPSVWLAECLSCHGDRSTETIEDRLYRIGDRLRIVASEQEANGVSTGAFEDKGSRIATLGKRPSVTSDDNLVLEVGDAGGVVDDSIEADIDDRAER